MTMSRRLGFAGVVLAALAAVVFGLHTVPAQAGGTAAATLAAPTAAPSTLRLCPECVAIDDAICWEMPPFRCTVRVFIGWVAKEDVVVRYATIDGSAVAGVDYVPVEEGLVTVPAGSQVGTGDIELIAGKPLDEDRTFAVKLFGQSQGELVRPVATVTIAAGEPQQAPEQK
jgi:hypothetical protein